MAGKIIEPEVEAVTEPEETHQEPIEEPQPEEPEIPEKYRGKSAAELAQMHQELEKLMGRQSQEVGELRKAFDDFVVTQAKNVPQETSQEEDEVDFFVDPKSAVRREIESHPEVQEARRVAQEYKQTNSLQLLQQKHPDVKEIVANQAFQDWISRSQFRQRLFEQADKQYDYEAADELFSLWKERADVVRKTKNAESTANRQQIKKAATGSTRSNPEGQRSKKIYRRADIRKLMKSDPDRYRDLADEILKAYDEGRVR